MATDILERLPHGIWLSDPTTGQLVYANRRLMEILGVGGSQCLHEPPFLPLVPSEDHHRLRMAVSDGTVVEHRLLGADGQYRWVRHWILPSSGLEGRPHLMGVVEETKLPVRPCSGISGSRFDSPSLLGRTSLLTQLRAERTASAMLVLDIDGLIATTAPSDDDLVGLAMAEVVSRVRHVVRSEDVVGVLKPCVLGVLLGRVSDYDFAHHIAQRIRAVVEEPLAVGTIRTTPIASVGVVLPDPTEDTPERLLADAELAARQASKTNPTRIVIFDPEARKSVHRRLQLQDDLRNAVEKGEIDVHYQPIFSSLTDAIAGVEALARWYHPTRGLVSPVEFIPLAEEMGLIGKLDTIVMSKACRQVARWNTLNDTGPELFLSVNLSAVEIVDPALVSRVLDIAKKTGLSPGALKLEVTEGILVQHPQIANRVMRSLESRGICFSLDDFGTGYSALSYLHRYRFRTLKIDRSFVQRINDGDRSSALVRSIIVLARTMGMDVVAEGVETLEQMRALSEMGCDYMQGFYLARPMPGPALANILASQTRARPAQAA